jgi:hypothetical protein
LIIKFKQIKLKWVYYNNVSIGFNNQMIATIDSPHSLITGLPGIIKFDKEGNAYTVIKTAHPTHCG